ncbi:DMT family transporter [Clostridium sp. AWRP]|uniref:DMT family transporter n=1 Tax=Clostridium sp. AWRP TaxID=2212991 RepID=UPI000FDB785E|nr:DMT family transporter [Clostridium sp. AWRP]AZV56594.1 DMT family transporter [Clostridium sp. AWRP]
MTKTESNIVLFSITVCWAFSYIFIKNISNSISAFSYLTMTSGVASIILTIVFLKKLREYNKKILFHAFILALILCGNSVFEKIGLATIPASSAAFVASLNIVFVPLMMLAFKKTISLNNMVGIILILIGVIVNSGVKFGQSLNEGFFIMTLATFCMSVYIITVDNFAKKDDPLLLGIGQMFFTFAIAFVLWFIENPKTFFTITYTNSLLANIFLLAFFSKAYAYIMLVYSQKYASPISVTVIASMEPVVTMVLALLIPNAFGNTEILSVEKVVGCLFILCGSIFAGTNFLNRIKSKLKERCEEGVTISKQ